MLVGLILLIIALTFFEV